MDVRFQRLPFQQVTKLRSQAPNCDEELRVTLSNGLAPLEFVCVTTQSLTTSEKM